MTTFSIKEIFGQGWATFKKNPWFFVGATFALSVFSMIVNALTGNGSGFMGFVGFLIGLAASTVVTIAYTRMALAATANEPLQWDALWAPEHFWNMLGTTILQGIVIIVGLVLLIVPGIIAALILSMSQLIVVNKKIAPVAAMKESYRLTKGHLFQLFLFGVSVVLFNILGLLALVVGLLVTIPITIIMAAFVYRKLLALQGTPIAAPQPANPPTAPTQE